METVKVSYSATNLRVLSLQNFTRNLRILDYKDCKMSSGDAPYVAHGGIHPCLPLVQCQDPDVEESELDNWHPAVESMHSLQVENAYDCYKSTANILGHRKKQKTNH